MYSFIFTSKLSQFGKDTYLMHILFNEIIVDSIFVSFPEGTTQEVLDQSGNEHIDYLEELNG